MSIEIHRAQLDALGFDLASAITAFQEARTAHAQTEGEPAPSAHPLVELITRSGGGFVIIEPPVVEPPEVPPISLTAYAADLRWRREVAGVTVSGVPIATDDRSKLMITGARVAAMADPAWSTTWHGADGNSYPVDAATMILISDEVQNHVNQSFATFAIVKAAIEAGTIPDQAGVDAAFAAAPT